MSCRVTIDSHVRDLKVGLVEAIGVQIAPPEPALVAMCRDWVEAARTCGPAGGEERRQAVRQLLRGGGFKPSGRSKPAQEYLARTAAEGLAWPVIFNAVDLLNVISLRSGLPISLLALARAGLELRIRYGRPQERFVFNAAGQELDLAGLLCVCRCDGELTVPCGTPVKDSQFAKVTVGDTHTLSCLYAPRSAVSDEDLLRWTQELADGLRTWCGAAEVRCWLASASG